MALNVTRYLSFHQQFEAPSIVFQKRKFVFDRELNDTQWLNLARDWKNNKEMVGVNIVQEGFTLTANANPALIDVSPVELVFDDGVAAVSREVVNLNVSALAAGTYDVVASIIYALKESTDDADLTDPTYGTATTSIITQVVTFSVLAATPSHRIADTTLTNTGSTGSGPTLRYAVVSNNDYSGTPNRFSLGSVELATGGKRYMVEDQQDNTPIAGKTTFIVDPGPNQAAPTFSGGVGGWLVQPFPFYGPINSYAVRYLKLGSVVVTGTPPNATVSSVTSTVSTYKSNKDMRTAFVSEHYTNGSHGPVVNITNTSTTNALNVVKSGTGNALEVYQNAVGNALVVSKANTGAGTCIHVDNSGTGSGIVITQVGAAVALGITRGAGGVGTEHCIQITNNGIGQDIVGNASNWYISKLGNATFAYVNATTLSHGGHFVKIVDRTISGDAITIDNTVGMVRLIPESGNHDHLGYIHGGSDGQILIVAMKNVSQSVEFLEIAGADTINDAGSRATNNRSDRFVYMFDAPLSKWCEMSAANNA